MVSERDRIRKRIHATSPNRWRADAFDVRYYLISELKKIHKKIVLDIGGGIGIICSEMDHSNFRVMMDLAFNDLKKCRHDIDPSIHPVCASFTNLPFRDNYFDIINCSHIIELTKYIDVKNKQMNNGAYPTVKNLLSEIYRVLQKSGTVYLTTPNNAYFKGNKLNYDELKNALSQVFDMYKILFFNTYPKFSNNRKLDMGNVLPKLKSRVMNPDKIIKELMKKNSKNNFSKYFYCILKKHNVGDV